MKKYLFDDEVKMILGAIVGALLVLVIIFFTEISNWMNEHDGIVTLSSVLVAVIIFLFTRELDLKKHKSEQRLKLRSLLQEIRLVKQHLQWVGNYVITDHFVHEVDSNSYNQSLDAVISGKYTLNIIETLFKLSDKIKLINYHGPKIRDYIYDKWLDNGTETNYERWLENFRRENNSINLFHSKKLRAIEEANRYAEHIECILNESFNIR